MSGPNRRDLARRVGTLEESADSEGFHAYEVGPRANPDSPRNGHYRWDARRAVYENEHGCLRHTDHAPDSAFNYSIHYE